MWSVSENLEEPVSLPERTCVGCRRVGERGELLRLRVIPDPPYVLPDLGAKLGGRGVWLCARRACVRSAVRKGGLARALKRRTDGVPNLDEASLASLFVAQLERRILGLLGSAARTRRAAIGTDAVGASIESRAARLLVVAEDAAGRRDELEAAARHTGLPQIVFGTKGSLGQLFGRGELGVISVLDAGIATELVRAAERVTALSEDE